MSCSRSMVCCPIELEPRTLSQGQLTHAREAAADVVGKMEQTDAATIFTKGLKPVRTSKEMERSIVLADVRDYHEVGDDDVPHEENEGRTKERMCHQCSCSAAVCDSPDETVRIKEPVSSPF